MNEQSQQHEIRDVACTVCGCVCDDLRITVEDDHITALAGSCPLSEEWFLSQNRARPAVAEIEERPVVWDTAIEHCAKILTAARSPLIFGLSRSSTHGQRAAVRLADQIGACIDTTASLCHAPSIMAIQQVGESTCTLGEVRNRADLVIFWGVDPQRSHPRHMERYSVYPRGEFLPGGRTGRTVVVIDTEMTETAARADIYLPVSSARHFDLIWQLRALIRGVECELPDVDGVPAATVAALADRMKKCRCGVVFFGLGLARAQLGHRNVEALLRLIADLNAHTRFHARRMRLHGDVTGADTVLCWQTGYPFAVNLSRGYPRYNPGEYSANTLLERGEVDACVFVGSEGMNQLSRRAIAHLKTIPTIVLDYPTVTSPLPPTVRFTTAVYGVHLAGTAYRMDEVPIALRPLLTTHYPSDREVLDRLLNAVRG